MSFGSAWRLSFMDVLVISGHITAADIPSLCSRARAVACRGKSGENMVLCDVGAIEEPDAVCVEALARVRLTIKRLGREVRFLRVGPELNELIDLIGLCGALPGCGRSAFEARRESEEREHPGRVEEETDPVDPTF